MGFTRVHGMGREVSVVMMTEVVVHASCFGIRCARAQFNGGVGYVRPFWALVLSNTHTHAKADSLFTFTVALLFVCLTLTLVHSSIDTSKVGRTRWLFSGLHSSHIDYDNCAHCWSTFPTLHILVHLLALIPARKEVHARREARALPTFSYI